MSCEGPVISIQPPAMNPTPPHYVSLKSSQRRSRASSTNDALSPEFAFRPRCPSPSPLMQTNSLAVSPPNFTHRSQSLPRGSRCTSAEPELTPSVSFPESDIRRSLISPRMMRRAETIETPEIRREELEEYTRVNQYKVLDIIGHGSYGIVRKATDDKNEVFAMKIVGKRRLRRKTFPVRPRVGSRGMQVKSPLDDVRREIAILKKLDHPNVVRLIEVLDDPQEDELILVFEYIPSNVIDELPLDQPLSEDQARGYFIDVLLGLEYLHSQHIIHRDIKPQNLLLDDDNRVKIADFGVSEVIDTSEAHLSRSAGTPAFLAPECVDVSRKTYRGQSVDIWAAGVTLYCFVYGKVPWSSSIITVLHEKIQQEPVPFLDEVPISPELKDLLNRLLEKDPDKRITIPEIREHPWILQNGQVLPSKEKNCQEEIAVSEEDIKTAFKPFNTPIHILVMIKTMAKKRSLTNPYSSRGSPAGSPAGSPRTSPKHNMATSSHNSRREQFAKTHNTPSICVESYDKTSS